MVTSKNSFRKIVFTKYVSGSSCTKRLAIEAIIILKKKKIGDANTYIFVYKNCKKKRFCFKIVHYNPQKWELKKKITFFGDNRLFFMFFLFRICCTNSFLVGIIIFLKISNSSSLSLSNSSLVIFIKSDNFRCCIS